MPEVERVDAYTGKFYFASKEECIEWCENTSFVGDKPLQEVKEIFEEKEVARITMHFDVPPDIWTGYCEEEPRDVRDVLKKVEERPEHDAPFIGE